ncbi:hypothetical protein F5884DRAFT_767684 [Xylogone sp. PMI_703]|nr:hypothetical protein F5884DRAFT_767684 [Xylogone sp. PMI_703]
MMFLLCSGVPLAFCDSWAMIQYMWLSFLSPVTRVSAWPVTTKTVCICECEALRASNAISVGNVPCSVVGHVLAQTSLC